MIARRYSTLALTTIASLLPRLVIAQQSDIIRGRVVGPDSAAIQNAVVMAIDTVKKTSRPTRTGAGGTFALTFDSGSGVYSVVVSMLGYAPQRRVITRAANGSMPTMEFKLSPIATQLAATRTVSQRPRTPRSDVTGDYSVGGQTSNVSLASGLSGDATGDLTAILTTLPGISVIPTSTGGPPSVSAFGVGADQNGLVLNGMGFGALVPRDGFQVAVVSATYDPGKGGFAGVQLALRMSPGGVATNRSLHATLDHPSLQWTSPVAAHLGSRYDQQILSGALNGPLSERTFYATSFQLTRRASDLATLASADATALAALNINSDSVGRLLQSLHTIGIPVTTPRVPDSRVSTEGRLAARFDWNPDLRPSPPGSFFVANSTVDDYSAQFGGTWRNSGGLMAGPTALPSSGGEQDHRDAWMQLTAAKFLPRNFLNEATVSLNGADDRTVPYLDLPAARILVSSPLGDGISNLSTLQAGGNGSPRARTRTWSGEVRDQITWNSWSRYHSFAITLDATHEGYALQQDAGYGAFTFNSLADFAAGAPTSYSRTLTSRHTSGSASSGAVGIGDTYTPWPAGSLPLGTVAPSRPTVQYGLRMEASRFGAVPDYNGLVDSTFHRRTDHVPEGLRIMPMIGFSWSMLPEIRLSNGINLGRRGNLSGGVREYRGVLTARALDGYSRQTGLPDAVQQLTCIGSATPVPDWLGYGQSLSTIPTSCAGGGVSTPLAQATPNVALFSPDYAFYDSWRPSLSFRYNLLAELQLTANAIYAFNRNVPGSVDLNFRPVPGLTLPTERNRPVYVSASSIIPGSGIAAWSASRISPAFAHVTESKSDRRADVGSFGGTATFRPIVFNPTGSYGAISASYTFNDAREQVRGFGGTTAGDPNAIEWSRASISRHVITMQVARSLPRWGNISLQGRAQSGARFTPIVAGDVNGDGYVNDRAFIFNPALTSDPALSTAMADLLRTAPASARECLQRQLGTIAGSNSCEGPWSFTQLNASISPDAYRFGFRNRGSVTLYLNNLLSGLDQAVHGSNHLHGWGQYAYADPTLLTIRGFDPTSRSFRYSVNPLFGSTTQFRNTFRTPFLLTLDVRIEVGPDRETAYLESLLRVPAGASALSERDVKFRIARSIDPVQQILQERESLSLTVAQVDSMTAISRRSTAVRDSVVAALARYLLGRHGEYSGEDVRQRWHVAGVASYAVYLQSIRQALGLFTPAQLERSKSIPQLQGILTIESIRDADVAFMVRSPMSSIP